MLSIHKLIKLNKNRCKILKINGVIENLSYSNNKGILIFILR